MSKIYCIVVVLEFTFPRQGVVPSTWFLGYPILVVADIPTHSPPTDSILGVYARVHQWLHSVVVKRIWFEHVDDIEAVSSTSSSVLQPEVEPLRVALRQIIRR